jgi:penicillin-binding protein 1A
LPVDIWSKFMKAAHQGVPVIGLPGVSRGPLTASLTPFGSPFGPPRPPAAVSDAEGPVRPAASSGGIDNWFIDRLFGRR